MKTMLNVVEVDVTWLINTLAYTGFMLLITLVVLSVILFFHTRRKKAKEEKERRNRIAKYQAEVVKSSDIALKQMIRHQYYFNSDYIDVVRAEIKRRNI